MYMYMYSFRVFFLFSCAVVLISSSSVPINVSQIKASGKSGNKFKLVAKCEFGDMEPIVGVGNATFTIQLDRPTSKFSSKEVTVQSTTDTSYMVTNTAEISRNKFSITFNLIFNTPPRCFPTGTCSHGKAATTTTSTTATTQTTTAPTTTGSGFGDIEYIQNGDMESDFTDEWSCVTDCIMEPSTDSLEGNRSAKITNRDKNWKGLSQNLNITPGLRYSISGYIKLLNTVDNAMYHAAEIVLSCGNNQGDKQYLKFGTNKMVQPGVWTELGAVLTVPTGFNEFRMYVQVFGLADYVADKFSMREVPDIQDWRTQAEARIDRHRKADINISINSANALPANLTMEVSQIRHGFAFGSAVGATEIVDTADPVLKKYQDFFYDNFEWAVIENALKWRLMEWTQGNINYDRPLNAINALRDRGVKVRGHSIFWGFEKNVPSWILNFTQQETLDAINTRINGVISNTSGLLEHWDVNNENLHGDYFERKTRDVNITMRMFEDIHAIDSTTKLFLNDFGIMEARGCQKATAMKVQAQMFQDAGVPIHGIGIQSHLKNSNLDITAMKERLDKVAEAGLPIWITEFSMDEADENKKAQALEAAFTLYFSHPAVEGILIWGFWDGKIWKENSSLVEGSDMTPNAAGIAYQTLFKKTWRTRETRDIINTNTITLRGFKGDYIVAVKQDGLAVKTTEFALGDSGSTIEINLDL